MKQTCPLCEEQIQYFCPGCGVNLCQEHCSMDDHPCDDYAEPFAVTRIHYRGGTNV
jgi:hypothetical protein